MHGPPDIVSLPNRLIYLDLKGLSFLPKQRSAGHTPGGHARAAPMSKTSVIATTSHCLPLDAN